VLLYGLFTDTEPIGDLSLRQSFDTPQNKRIPAYFGKLVQSVHNDPNLLLKFNTFLGVDIRRWYFQSVKISA